MKLTVYCLEGPHGTGKTTLINKIKEMGFNIRNEEFITDIKTLNPQSLTMELLWIAKFINELINLTSNNNDNQIIFADRSIISAILYSENGELLREPINKILLDLYKIVNIKTIYIRSTKEDLWNRIQKRLLEEPIRNNYRENDYNWMETVYNFYESYKWDYIIDNIDLEKTIKEIICIKNISI